MSESVLDYQGEHGRIHVRRWPHPTPRYAAIIAHGYAEHGGRYEHVAAHLVENGAIVYAPDHLGHGQSDGERGLVSDVDVLVRDLLTLVRRVRFAYTPLPLVLIGHSMGGLVATRFAQVHGSELSALVLSAPVIGRNPGFEQLLQIDPMPEVGLDPALLSRDASVGAAYAADPLVYHGPLKRTTLSGLFSAVDRVTEGPTLGALPTLWLHGSADQLSPIDGARATLSAIGGSLLATKVYAGARHEIFNETNRADVVADVASFIGRTLA